MAPGAAPAWAGGDRIRVRAGAAAWLGLSRVEWLFVAVLILVAALFRFSYMGQVPPGMDFDEAYESLEAHRVLTQPGYHPVFFPENNGVPPVKVYLNVLAFALAGEHTDTDRYISAILGALTVLALYLFLRALFPTSRPDGSAEGSGHEPAPFARYLPFAAGLILAFLPWHVNFSRRGIEPVLLPLWAILALYFLWAGLKSRRYWPFGVSGLFWGSAVYTYQAAAFLPGLLIVFLIYKGIQERGFLRRYARHLILLAGITALALVPLALYTYDHADAVMFRAMQVTLLTPGRVNEPHWVSLTRSVWKTGLYFVQGGDINPADNIPTRPPFPLAFALALGAGIAVALRRARRPEYALLVIWFAWLLLPTMITEDAPSIRRAIGSTPALAALIALGLTWSLAAAARFASRERLPRWQKPARMAGGVAGIALLAYGAAWSYQYYFVDWGRGRDLYHHFDVGLVDAGRYAAAAPADARLFYTPTGSSDRGLVHLPLAWELRDRNLRTFDGRYGLVLAPPGSAPTLYLVTTFLGDTVTLPRLSRLYPTGRILYESRNLYGIQHTAAFVVPPGVEPVVEGNRVGANFGGQVELVAAQLAPAEVHPGETITATLYWRSLSGPTPVDYTAFTHLLGPPNPADGSGLWVGQDHPPLRDSYPTTRWAVGEMIVDPHTLTVPATAPAGAYQLEVGLYAPAAGGARLRVVDPAGSDPGGKKQGDSALAGALSVR